MTEGLASMAAGDSWRKEDTAAMPHQPLRFIFLGESELQPGRYLPGQFQTAVTAGGPDASWNGLSWSPVSCEPELKLTCHVN